MSKANTWSQNLVARLTGVTGEPEWRRFKRAGICGPFSRAKFRRVTPAGVDVFIIECSNSADNKNHAGLSLGGGHFEIVVFAEYDEAPDGCSVAAK